MYIPKFLPFFVAFSILQISFAADAPELSVEILESVVLSSAKGPVELINSIYDYLTTVKENANDVLRKFYEKLDVDVTNATKGSEEILNGAVNTLNNKYQEWTKFTDEKFQNEARYCLLGQELAQQLSQTGSLGIRYCSEKIHNSFKMEMLQSRLKYDAIIDSVENLYSEFETCDEESCREQIEKQLTEIHNNLQATMQNLFNEVSRSKDEAENYFKECVTNYSDRYSNTIKSIQKECYECLVSLLGKDVPQ